jgi:mRNA interferase MazF
MKGDVYRLPAPREVRGHEQRAPWFAVVVQSDDVRLSTWMVAPTSTSAQPSRLRPEVKLDSIVTPIMVEQSRVVDPERLGPYPERSPWNP